MKPMLFPAPLQHRHFVNARTQFTELVRASPGGKIIALVGPTQVGKSLIFEQLVRTLNQELRLEGPGAMPVVSVVAATSQDGRISPKHLNLKLLKALRHPIYEHIGEFDELTHYRPSRGRDEGSMRVALEAALAARSTMYVMLDEAHHLTHTNNAGLRANVIQSIKCIGAIDRTLVLVGGYELAYRGLFDSAHFAGRLVCVELAPYAANSDDLAEWLRILKFCSKHVTVTPESLLLDEAEQLLEATNGCFGLLEKILWIARSLSGSCSIDRARLRAAFPLEKEHAAVKIDIEAGKQALARIAAGKLAGSVRNGPSKAQEPRKPASPPFKRKPNRILPSRPVLADD